MWANLKSVPMVQKISIICVFAFLWACDTQTESNQNNDLDNQNNDQFQQPSPPTNSDQISSFLKPLVDTSSCDQEKSLPSAQIIRRLSKIEYANTLQALFESADLEMDPYLDLIKNLPADEENLGFDNQAKSLQVSPIHIEQYQKISESFAKLVHAQSSKWIDCQIPTTIDAQSQDQELIEQCVKTWVNHFGKFAWRRPLNAAEKNRMFSLFEDGMRIENGQIPLAMSLVAEAFLQSPHFLYRVEISSILEDDSMIEVMTDFNMDISQMQSTQMQSLLTSFKDQGLRKVNPYEIANRLSYLLWRSMPDQALFQAVEDGELDTIEGIYAQAHRMLLDPKAKDGLWSFFEQWLSLSKLDRIEKDLDGTGLNLREIRDLWASEARLFVTDVVFEAKDMRQLFKTDFRYLNDQLASLYGLPLDQVNPQNNQANPQNNQAFPLHLQKVKQAQPVGLMTLGVMLGVNSKANMTDPVHRGIFVREKLLCQPLPAPPPNVPVVAPDPSSDLTTRERFREHSENPVCYSCHRLVDPIGVGLENLDHLGRWRDTEKSKPIDASGSFINTLDINGDFNGPYELNDKLAQSQQTQRCAVLQFYRYAMGRSETEADLCAVQQIYDDFAQDNFDFQSLLMSIIGSTQFRYRLHQETL